MYRLNKNTGTLSLEGVVIPQDESSELFQEYQTWLRAGNTVQIITQLVPTEEKSMLTSKFMEKLQSVAADLRIRAKAAAIDKKGEQAYIFSQVELYELKYRVASGAIQDPYMISLLENESVEFGVTFEAFCELIMYMYETARATYEKFLLMIERCRTKIQTLIENESWAQVEQGFAFVATLENQEQAEGIMASILAL